jgi:hypothetical protein
VSPDESSGSAGDELDTARRALVGRREAALLDEPSVAAVARVLVRRVRDPAVWVRAAVTTLDRFGREVADGDLPGLLEAGRADPSVAERSLSRLAARHDGLTGGQLASLAFGPRLWWTVGGVEVPWRPLSTAGGAVPLPGRDTDPDLRLLLLAVLGSGASESELLGVRVGDAGRLDAEGRLVPDLAAEPLAVRYRDDHDGREHVTFLSFEARAAVQDRLEDGRPPAPDEPLLLPEAQRIAASDRLRATSAALIGAGNDVNVTLCRATGDFFRAWGMPGARFEDRARSERGSPAAGTDSSGHPPSTSPTSEEPT